ncbi:hypothetical protein O181_027576 [Austropuccinia psidii MF-1]|uniref:Uncharacterized protein n=1 Tax=Austropuccinia psidii MF-1 TaxID=1389203 RepID=A0A9Q3CML5_9BASI|nr:hypothetical protein [Austropuccinia psidii MF-1]
MAIDNLKSNPAYKQEVYAKIPIHFMEIDRKRNLKSSEWAPGSGSLDTDHIRPEETGTAILGIQLYELQNELFNLVDEYYESHKQGRILLPPLQQKYRCPELGYQ